LKDTFGIKDGLADNRRVTVLDFACGTGTFLLEVFERIFAKKNPPAPPFRCVCGAETKEPFHPEFWSVHQPHIEAAGEARRRAKH
jgi:hypothetical protein